MFKKTIIQYSICAALLGSVASPVYADLVEARGVSSDVSIKANKDQSTARAIARREAERSAVKSALKLKLNVEAQGAKADEAIAEMVKSLGGNMKTTFRMEGDILTATSVLSVDSAELTDMSRSLGLQNMSAMESASIVFLIDEYWGIATNLDPSKPLVSEIEYSHDKSSSSDTSSKSSASGFSDTSSKSASSSTYSGATAASSRESAAYSANQRTAVAGSSASAVNARDNRAVAVQDGAGGSAAASRSTQVSAAQQNSFAGSSSSNVAAARSSDTRVASSVNASSASASDKKNIQASSASTDQKNIQNQKDVVSFKQKSVFPDVNNAKPSDQASALITQRLAQVTKQYGLEYSPERDLRETGKGRMLISDIENQRRFDEYTQRVSKNPYNAKFVVFGTSVMNAEGKSASGRTVCSGMLKLDSFNVDTGRGLMAGTLNKIAEGTSDQDCRSNLSTALATELAQTVGNAATRSLQLAATLGQAYTVTLFSTANIPRRIGGAFEDALRELGGGNLKEEKRTDATRVYTMAAKGGDLSRRIEKILDTLGDGVKDAEVQSKGNRVVICLEGRCPKDY